MGHGACLQPGYIEIDAETWAAARAGHQLEDLTWAFDQWADTLAQQTTVPLDALGLFIAARAGGDWLYAEDAVITVSPDTASAGSAGAPDDAGVGGGDLSLSATLIVYRYTDLACGPVAFVEILDRPGAGPGTGPTAYADVGPVSAWADLEVSIICPQGHLWLLTGDELVDNLGTSRLVTDVFPDGRVVTTDQRLESDAYADPQLLCPACSAACDVALPGLTDLTLDPDPSAR